MNLFSIVFFLGATQGLILALYLFFSGSDKRQAKSFLGALILVLSYDMFETALFAQRIRLFTTDLFAFSLLFTLGPSLYFTIRTSINPEGVPRRTIWRHYLIAIVDFVISAVIFALRFDPLKRYLSIDTFIAINSTHLISTRLLMVVVFWVYFVLSVGEYRKFERSAADAEWQVSLPERDIIKKWLRSFLYVCFVIAIVWTLTILGVIFFNRQRVLYFYYPLELLLAFLVYWIGFTGYHRIKVIYLKEQQTTKQHFNKLPTGEIEAAIAALSQAMNVDKVYLDPELTLTKLSERVKLSPKTISAILNQHLNLGFNEYVNSFRVEEAKRRLSNPKNEKLTVLAIAFDSGFNSLATFQRVFKRFTGVTPRQFSGQIREKS